MHNKNVKQSRIHRLFGIKVKSKLAAAYMDTAVKILICVVCGALFLTGIYGVIQKVVLPKTESSVTSMFAYEAADAGNGGGAGGSGGVETPGVNEEYEMLDGADQEYNIGASYTPLTFRSAAPIDTFQEVKVDGETVNGSNYTVTEGSTIVTFNADYSKTLASGDHTVEIVSNTGTAEANFEISNLIPEGATYNQGANPTLKGGDKFPETVKDGDIYKFGDYEYRYNYYYGGTCWHGWDSNSRTNGWSARVIDDTKTKYDTVLDSINGKPVNTLTKTFYGCTQLTEAPVIPTSVQKLTDTFYNCTALTKGPIIPKNVTHLSSTFMNTKLAEAPVIPNGVINMSATFYGCPITKAPIIPNGVTDLSNCFVNCTQLTEAPDLSKCTKLTNMVSAFKNCTQLTEAPVIPSSAENVNSVFQGCTQLTEAPDLSKCTNITNFSNAFRNCTKLTEAPVIPSGVTNVSYAFYGCKALTGSVTINSTPETYTKCLYQTQVTEVLGNCEDSIKEAILATK